MYAHTMRARYTRAHAPPRAPSSLRIFGEAGEATDYGFKFNWLSLPQLQNELRQTEATRATPLDESDDEGHD